MKKEAAKKTSRTTSTIISYEMWRESKRIYVLHSDYVSPTIHFTNRGPWGVPISWIEPKMRAAPELPFHVTFPRETQLQFGR